MGNILEAYIKCEWNFFTAITKKKIGTGKNN